MKKFGIGFLYSAFAAGFFWIAQPDAAAIPAFKKEFEKVYVDKDAADAHKQAFAEAANSKTGKCWICHVNMKPLGEEKLGKKVRNNYGNALSQFLEKEDYSSQRRKEEPEKVSAEIHEAFKKVGAMNSDPQDPNSPTFDELIATGKLPGNGDPNPEDLKKAIADRNSKSK